MFKRIYVERDNLWAALDFSLKRPGEAAAAAELAVHLVPYWSGRGPFSDVRRVFTSLAEVAGGLPARAQLLLVAAAVASFQSDLEAFAALSREGLRIGTLLSDSELVAYAFDSDGDAPSDRGEHRRSWRAGARIGVACQVDT